MLERSLRIRWLPDPKSGSSAVFLWGPRQTGKTTQLTAVHDWEPGLKRLGDSGEPPARPPR